MVIFFGFRNIFRDTIYDNWDQVYSKELSNFEDIGDIGEIWFGETSELKVINYLDREELVNLDSSIIDLGCGNGHLCLELVKEGYSNITGVDYSTSAIDLAISLARQENLQDRVTFLVKDILSEDPTATYDIILDKGTYDAVSLNPDDTFTQRCNYWRSVANLLRSGGLFVLTSCNWTVDELKNHSMELSKNGNSGKSDQIWSVHTVLPSKTFQFKGCVGSDNVCIVFRKQITGDL